MESELKFVYQDGSSYEDIINEPLISDHLLATGNMSYAMRSAYFDSEDELLRKRKGFLRIRRSNERFYLTLKLPIPKLNTHGGGIFERQEWEIELTDEEHFWDAKAGINPAWFLKRLAAQTENNEQSDPDLVQILQLLEGRPLQEVCLADYTRITYPYNYRTSRFELCFDEGYLGTSEHIEYFSEIELELLSGQRKDLVSLQEKLLDQLPLLSATKSKYDQAIALADLFK